MKQPEIETIIYQVFDNLMEQSTELELEKQQSTPLVGDCSVLDSLGLVNFLVALEQLVEIKFPKLHDHVDHTGLEVNLGINQRYNVLGTVQPL